MRKIYLAASWRHPAHTDVLKALREDGHTVYNFKRPGDPEGPFPHEEDNGGFHWSDIDKDWKSWTPEQFRSTLWTTPLAARGYSRDMRGMRWCDTIVMIHPSGRSAHLEAGWLCGYRDAVNERVKAYALVLPGEVEPELMYRMFDDIACSIKHLLHLLRTN